MSTVPISAAREAMADVVEASATEAVVLERYGKPVAVVVSPARYEELMDSWEELSDVDAFDAAMAEEGPSIPWDEVKADLGWQ